MIKRIIALMLTVFLSAACLGGCGKASEDEKIKILCTVFPVYDWVKNIVGDTENIEVSLLVGNGTDLHSYQPSAADMIRLASAHMIVYIGGESDAWLEEALKKNAKEDCVKLKLFEAEGLVTRRISARSILSDAENCEEEDCHDHDHDHGHGAVDEHIWLSPRNAKACVSYITEQLCLLDEANSESYRNHSSRYLEQLTALDAAYEEAVSASASPTLICADRFPFVYLTEDYHIPYIAAFEGCSTETDATPDTVIRLAAAVNEQKTSYLVVTESSDQKLAQSVIRATEAKDARIAVMDSMQSVTAKEAEAGVSYLSVSRSNLEILRQVLAP